MHLTPMDYDLLEKRRAAAESLGFVFSDDGIAFMGCRLLRHVGRARYKQKDEARSA